MKYSIWSFLLMVTLFGSSVGYAEDSAELSQVADALTWLGASAPEVLVELRAKTLGVCNVEVTANPERGIPPVAYRIFTCRTGPRDGLEAVAYLDISDQPRLTRAGYFHFYRAGKVVRVLKSR